MTTTEIGRNELLQDNFHKGDWGWGENAKTWTVKSGADGEINFTALRGGSEMRKHS